MASTFTAQINDIVTKTEKRMNALIRQSTQMVIDDAQATHNEGGRMRVDTGFLRASGQVSFTGMPSGPSRPEKSSAPSSYSASSVVLELGKAQIGDTIYFGWTANYAKYREVYDGFLAGAVQKWPQFVEQVCNDIVRRIP